MGKKSVSELDAENIDDASYTLFYTRIRWYLHG